MRKNCIFQTCSFLLKKNEKEFCLKSSLIIKKVFLIFILLCGYQNIYSQSNDCDDNLSGQLIVGSSCSATVFNSTNDTDYWNSASGCNASDVDDAWGWFIATSTSTIITYTPTALEDPVLTLFSGSCSTAMTALSCADSYGGAQAETITYATTIGTKYRIRIQRYASNSSMYGTICIYSPIPPVNDACSSATNLPCATTNLSGTTLNSVSETHNTGCSMSNYGVWYTFTGDGTINTITTTPSTGYNIEMSISSGSCGSLTSINCQDANGGGIAETYTFTTVSGTQYYIYIAENTSGDLGTGNFTISRTCNITPTYCTPSVGSGFESLVYFNNISFVGTLNDVSNSSTYTTTPTRGYQNFTSLSNIAKQAQGEGVNISMQMSSRGYVKAWVDWNSDGDFVDTNETVYNTAGIATYSTTFGFIIPANQALGNYRIRIRVNKDDNTYPYDTNAISTFDSCQNINYYGETEDYIFTVVASCSAIITSVTDGVNCGAGPVTLNAVASGSPTQYKWYANETGGTAIATTTTGTWTTPSLSTTTTYWVSAYNGCESLERKKVIANINPIATISFTPSVPEICGENQVLSLTASGDVQQNYLINENFELGLGTLTNQNIISNTSAINTITQWQTKSSTFVPAQQVWFPAIASGMSGNKFAMSTSDVGSYTTHNALISQNVNTNTFLNLTLSFNIFYSRYYVDNANPTLDYVTVDVSTDGGTTWIEIDKYLSDIGYGTRFTKKTYNLNSYINNSNFKVRIQYYGAWCDGLAIDDFQLYGNTPLNTAFNWSSSTTVNAYQDVTCTTPYVAGTPVATVYVKPSLAQLEEQSFSFTATATLSNGCNVSQNISIDNKSKIWKGGTNGDWNNPNNWLPIGVPDASTCVIIPSATNNSRIIGTNYNAFAKTVQVKSTGNLQLEPKNTITVTDWVEVSPGGMFDIQNGASLIQINNVANIGNIEMKRNVNIKKLDYVYWSTPVANFSLNAVSPGTTNYKYKWTPTISSNTNGWGNWAGANETMVIGKGYIVRGPDSFNNTLQNFTANFVGVPNNGNINMQISRGVYNGANYATGVSGTAATKDDDNWNLIGNPYPSAVNADSFLTTNTNIAGFIKLWSHGTAPSAINTDPFYNNFAMNYSVADYVTYNLMGAITPGFDGNIAAGQGFFVLMNHTSTATTENIVFNNTMRNNGYRNDLFYKNSTANSTIVEEKNRIWLDLISPSNSASRTLVGYATNATNATDRLYDAPALGVKSNFELYSLESSNQLSIQGRSLPFNTDDQVALGVTIPQNGVYTIAIASADGLFSDANQNIFLKDNTLGITHDLRIAPYSFTATTGTDENRFLLTYTNSALGNDDFENNNSITVFTNENINIESSIENIKSVQIFDLLGREIININDINNNSFIAQNVKPTQNALLVKVMLENGYTKTYKIIY